MVDEVINSGIDDFSKARRMTENSDTHNYTKRYFSDLDPENWMTSKVHFSSERWGDSIKFYIFAFLGQKHKGVVELFHQSTRGIQNRLFVNSWTSYCY
jgi:hypothetical protein